MSVSMRVWRSFFKSKYIMHTYTCYGVVCRRSAAFSCQHSGISTHADAYYTVIGGTQRSHWHTASFMCLFFFYLSLVFNFLCRGAELRFYFFLDAVLHFLSLSLSFSVWSWLSEWLWVNPYAGKRERENTSWICGRALQEDFRTHIVCLHHKKGKSRLIFNVSFKSVQCLRDCGAFSCSLSAFILIWQNLAAFNVTCLQQFQDVIKPVCH